MGLAQPSPQLRDGRIRAACNLRPDHVMQISQSRWHMTPLRQRRRLPRPPSPTEDFGYVGDTDAQQFCDPTSRFAIIRRREHPHS